MVKKLKSIAADSNLSATIRDSAQQIWLAGLGAFAIAILISGVFVAIVAFTTHVRFTDILVAYAPGAMDAMLALALTLHIDPIFVGAHHLSRFIFVTISMPGVAMVTKMKRDR